MERLDFTPLAELVEPAKADSLWQLLVLGLPDKGVFTWIVGFVAVVLASANVVGGFVVTDRMLEMFKKPGGGK